MIYTLFDAINKKTIKKVAENYIYEKNEMQSVC